MKLFIKNMVCPRCIIVIQQILTQHKIVAAAIVLGEAELKQAIGSEQMQSLKMSLEKVGFELLTDQKEQQVDCIKNLLIAKVQQGSTEKHFSLSEYLRRSLLKDYSCLSKLFSKYEGMTVEQFFILQKIEKAKEWITYKDSSLNEIASKLGYSSTQHLSTQFKKVTGLTPSQFKEAGNPKRKPLGNN